MMSMMMMMMQMEDINQIMLSPETFLATFFLFKQTFCKKKVGTLLLKLKKMNLLKTFKIS